MSYNEFYRGRRKITEDPQLLKNILFQPNLYDLYTYSPFPEKIDTDNFTVAAGIALFWDRLIQDDDIYFFTTDNNRCLSKLVESLMNDSYRLPSIRPPAYNPETYQFDEHVPICIATIGFKDLHVITSDPNCAIPLFYVHKQFPFKVVVNRIRKKIEQFTKPDNHALQ